MGSPNSDSSEGMPGTNKMPGRSVEQLPPNSDSSEGMPGRNLTQTMAPSAYSVPSERTPPATPTVAKARAAANAQEQRPRAIEPTMVRNREPTAAEEAEKARKETEEARVLQNYHREAARLKLYWAEKALAQKAEQERLAAEERAAVAKARAAANAQEQRPRAIEPTMVRNREPTAAEEA